MCAQRLRVAAVIAVLFAAAEWLFAPPKAAASKNFVQVGFASWYGEDFKGRKTASGERYRPDARTAAHRSLPFDTYVRVTNLRNGRAVVVRITNRGPFVRGRIIDVSRTAARELDMMKSGVVRVRVEVVQPGSARGRPEDL